MNELTGKTGTHSAMKIVKIRTWITGAIACWGAILFLQNREFPKDYCALLSIVREPASTLQHDAIPFVVKNELSLIEQQAHGKLLSAAQSDLGSNDRPFDDISISLPLHNDLFHSSKTGSEGDRFFVAPLNFAQEENDCIVYAAGLANSATFENYMAQSVGCEVHGFDCTVLGAKPEWHFTYHDICIGRPRTFEDNMYSKPKVEANRSFEFKTLDTIKTELGNDHIDIFKMDIEGFEWEILEEILELPDSDLPQQLLFELHTEGANSKYVPPSLVKGKTRNNVVAMFLRLYDRGYRVVFKDINRGDSRCADFTLLRLPLASLPKPKIHDF